MGRDSLKKSKIFSTKIFGLFLACLVILIVFLLDSGTGIMKSLELNILDINFRLKDTYSVKNKDVEGGYKRDPNPNISKDIVIVGIGDKTLERYGRWPFSRSIHADLLNSFSRIQDQTTRESSIFLDIFFVEESKEKSDDALLEDAIKNNDKVFLETILTEKNNNPEESIARQKVLFKKSGEITKISGVTPLLDASYGATPPLKAYGKNTAGYGHANFSADEDKIYRHQQIVARLSEEIDQIYLKDLDLSYTLNPGQYERLVWFDNKGRPHNIELNDLSKNDLNELKKTIQSKSVKKNIDFNDNNSIDKGETVFVLTKYQDHFIPSITLALALKYFNKKPGDIEVIFGDKIIIPEPKVYSPKEKKLIPYTVKGKIFDKVEIPINEKGEMLINFMGPRSGITRGTYYTYPVKPYHELSKNPPAADKNSWPERNPTLLNDNKILMVGAFSQGMAQDEKNTPFGLMYGIEIHTNALNTIIMDNYLIQLSTAVNYLWLVFIVLLIAFITTRIPTGWALLITVITEGVLFFIPSVLFDHYNILFENGKPMLTVLLTFIAIVVYRVFMEESDKKRVQGMFGKYVSPVVVEKMLDNPPQLGGVDADMTVFFSDIRGFTSLSETMSPQDLVALLNEYLTSMTDSMMDFDGTLDKYIGDAIMGFWGAPLPQENHAILACQCAIRQLELLTELNKIWPENKQIDIGIGLNSGTCTVGNMGSAGRMNYTVMGDNVNLASRLESINKQYKTRIIISEKTYNKIKGANFIVRELDDIRVKGKLEPIRIYELVGIDD